MSTTTVTRSTVTRSTVTRNNVARNVARTGRRFPLLKAGAASGVVAAVATTAVAVTAHAAGVSFADRTGESIPWLAFAQLTVTCAMLGVALAAGIRRRASQPRRTFSRTAWTLAVVSCAAPTLIGLEAAAVATLVVLHLIAAVVVIPAIAGRLPR